LWITVRENKFRTREKPSVEPHAMTHSPILPAVLSENVPLVLSRQLLQVFAHGLVSLPPDVHKPVAKE